MPKKSLSDQEPILVGVAHTDKNLPRVLKLIDQLAMQGHRTLGLERTGYPMEYAEKYARRPDTRPEFKSTLLSLSRMSRTQSEQDTTDFFGEIATFAEKKGMRVVELEGRAAQEFLYRKFFDRLNARWNKRVHRHFWTHKKILQNPANACDVFFSFYAHHVPGKGLDYLRTQSRSQQMVRRILRHRVDVALAGYSHMLDVARAFGIPPKKIIRIGVNPFLRTANFVIRSTRRPYAFYRQVVRPAVRRIRRASPRL